MSTELPPALVSILHVFAELSNPVVNLLVSLYLSREITLAQMYFSYATLGAFLETSEGGVPP
jgi:hypothetical protein